MKTIGKFLLLSLVHLLTFFLAFLAVAFLFFLMMKTDFGTLVVGHMTGGMPDIGASLAACTCSFFACHALADRINGHGSLWGLGLLTILFHIVFGLVNLFAGSGVAENIVQIIWGAMVMSSTKN